MSELPRDVQERIDANVRALLASEWVAPPQGEVTGGFGSIGQRVSALWDLAVEIERQRERHLGRYRSELES